MGNPFGLPNHLFYALDTYAGVVQAIQHLTDLFDSESLFESQVSHGGIPFEETPLETAHSHSPWRAA